MKTIIAIPTHRRRADFLAAVARSRKLFGRWTAPPKTAKEFDEYLKRFDTPTSSSYWILTEKQELAGVANISEIVRGRFLSGYLSYYAFEPHSRHGYMTEGTRTVVSKAFRTLRLHRLEANIQPGNERSLRLAQRLGFKLEGFSPRYLKIAGKWRDHERWAITAEDWAKIQRKNSGSKRQPDKSESPLTG